MRPSDNIHPDVESELRPAAETIAVCAYLIWEQEGRPVDRAAQHWIQAEEQLVADDLHARWVAANIAGGTGPPATPA